MDTWSLPKARPISCNDCPAFQRHHMSIRWFAESFTLLLNLINTTFREKIYTRWCCIDRLSWQGLSGVDGETCYKLTLCTHWPVLEKDGAGLMKEIQELLTARAVGNPYGTDGGFAPNIAVLPTG